MEINDPLRFRFQKKLSERKTEQLHRSLQHVGRTGSASIIRIEGKEYINFGSNDYLNLSNHPHLIDKSREYLESYGTGSASSRLISGSEKIHALLENRISNLYDREASLIFSTGFQANSTILPALTKKGDRIIADKFCHNSILTGCTYSEADLYRFRHNDLDHLERFLSREEPEGFTWIVTESVFSMDGDRAPLEGICSLAEKYGAYLYVDDAHAFGICGKNGLGLGAEITGIDLLISTFGKAAGSFGAFVTADQIIIDMLVNYCSGFIYTTAPPPSITGSMEAAFDLIPELKREREHLRKLAKTLHGNLKRYGFRTSDEPSHILPIIFGAEKDVLNVSKKLMNDGIFATAIRPPTVPENASRIRISITSDHSVDDLEQLLESLS